jgi:2'-5' RNA ligase superfamily
MPRTALIVVVPEAEPAVAALRLEHDWSAPLGVPAHVTVLYPFAGPDEVDEAELAEALAAVPPFDFTLDRVERFDAGAVWLHPEPSAPFAALTHAVWERFPDYPPYEGAFQVVIPHLTVSDVPLEVSVPLPIPSRADEVTWIEETTDGRWATRRAFPLQGVA